MFLTKVFVFAFVFVYLGGGERRKRWDGIGLDWCGYRVE